MRDSNPQPSSRSRANHRHFALQSERLGVRVPHATATLCAALEEEEAGGCQLRITLDRSMHSLEASAAGVEVLQACR